MDTQPKLDARDPRDPNTKPYKANRYSYAPINAQGQLLNSGAGLQYEDATNTLMNLMAMIFSMLAMLMKIKWCGWGAIFCSLIGYTTAQSADDQRQVLSSVLLGAASTVMSYMNMPGSLAMQYLSGNK